MGQAETLWLHLREQRWKIESEMELGQSKRDLDRQESLGLLRAVTKEAKL